VAEEAGEVEEAGYLEDVVAYLERVGLVVDVLEDLVD
jgi:hypothetical protein